MFTLAFTAMSVKTADYMFSNFPRSRRHPYKTKKKERERVKRGRLPSRRIGTELEPIHERPRITPAPSIRP